MFKLNKLLENMDDYFILLFYASTEKGTLFDDLDSIKVVGGLKVIYGGLYSVRS